MIVNSLKGLRARCVRRLFMYKLNANCDDALGGSKEERPTPKAFASGRSIRKALFPAGNLSHERVETRIAAKIVEQWIYFDERNVESGVVVAMLQFVDRVRLIA